MLTLKHPNFLREVYKSMKKLMCVLILVAFIGSMVVMTGCFGGSDGLGLTLGILAIAIVVASSGGGAAPVFAANTRASERPAIMGAVTSSKRFRGIIKNAQNVEIPATVGFNAENKLTIEASVTADSSNGQYTVEVFPINEATEEPFADPIYKHHFVKNVAAGATENYAENRDLASDTAEALIYDNWNEANKPTIDKTYIAPASINTVAASLTQQLNESTVGTSYYPYTTTLWQGYDISGLSYTAPAKTYSISGFVTQKDGSGGQDGVSVYAWSHDYEGSASTTVGVYSINVIPGTYQVYPHALDHSYTSQEVTVTDSNITGINFQAQ